MSTIIINEINECSKDKKLFAFYYTNSNEDIECIFVYPECISLTNTILFALDKTKENKVTYLISNIQPFTDFTSNAWDKYSECQGCRYGLANQLGHYGGCISESD